SGWTTTPRCATGTRHPHDRVGSRSTTEAAARDEGDTCCVRTIPQSTTSRGKYRLNRFSREGRQEGAGYSNGVGSPAPYRAISAYPADRSTTVVGTSPHSPASITASSWWS